MPPSSKRVSLSAGAIPLPSSASHRVMQLPRATTREPISRPAAGSVARAAPSVLVSSTTARPAGSLQAPSTSRTRTATSALPGAAPAVSSGSTRPSSSGTRLGSRAGLAPTSASLKTLPGLTRPSTTSSRPPTGSSHPSTTSSRPPATTTRSLAPAATTVRTISRAPTQRVEPQRSLALARPILPTTGDRPVPARREFGTDGSQATNRARGGSTSTASVLADGRLAKPTTGLPAASSRDIKARALSTPASAIARSRATGSAVPPLPNLPARTSMAPPPTMINAAGGLPRPAAVSRMPAPTAKMSSSASLADLRMRMDRLQARQSAKK